MFLGGLHQGCKKDPNFLCIWNVAKGICGFAASKLNIIVNKFVV